MRVAFDGAYLTDHYPGVGRYSYGLLKALTETPLSDLEIVLLLPEECDQNTRFRVDELSRKCNIRMYSSGGQSLLLRQLRLRKLLTQIDFDLFHSPFYFPPGLKRTPTITTIYDLIPLHFRVSMTPLRRLVYRALIHLTVRNSSHILTTTESSLGNISTRFPTVSGRITALYPGLDKEFRPTESIERQSILRQYRLPNRFVLYIGSNKPHKNLDTLLQAWERLGPSDVALVLGGFWETDSSRRRQILSKSRKTEIRILGAVPEKHLASLYGEAELFVFPSLMEGFGFPVLEAMACGCPTLCSNVISLREVAGTAAQFFNPVDVEELAEKIGFLLDKPELRQDLRERGFAQSRQFSWERTARETLNCYRKVSGST